MLLLCILVFMGGIVLMKIEMIKEMKENLGRQEIVRESGLFEGI